MRPPRKTRAAGGRRRAFTLIEMLVVISIIVILAGIMLPVISSARQEGHITYCLNNLHQIGAALLLYAQHYANGEVTGFPPWITLLTKGLPSRRYLDPRSLVCKSDASRGAEGGRPDGMTYEDLGTPIHQFEMADIDEHDYLHDAEGRPYLNGEGPKKKGDSSHGGVGINCSYIYEFCGEPCDWIYGGPPVSPGTVASVPAAPDAPEWLWGSGPPDWDTFLKKADNDGNGVLSWNEVKVLSRKGWKEYKLPAWHIRVPIVRCYWHVEGQKILRDDSLVLDLRGDASAAVRSKPKWYEK